MNTLTIQAVPVSIQRPCAVVGCSLPQVNDYVLVMGDATNTKVEYRFCKEHADQMFKGQRPPIPQTWDLPKGTTHV